MTPNYDNIVNKFLDSLLKDLTLLHIDREKKIVYHINDEIFFVLRDLNFDTQYVTINDSLTETIENFFNLDWITTEDITKMWFMKKYTPGKKTIHWAIVFIKR